jgi:hypothetical protein
VDRGLKPGVHSSDRQGLTNVTLLHQSTQLTTNMAYVTLMNLFLDFEEENFPVTKVDDIKVICLALPCCLCQLP